MACECFTLASVAVGGLVLYRHVKEVNAASRRALFVNTQQQLLQLKQDRKEFVRGIGSLTQTYNAQIKNVVRHHLQHFGHDVGYLDRMVLFRFAEMQSHVDTNTQSADAPGIARLMDDRYRRAVSQVFEDFARKMSRLSWLEPTHASVQELQRCEEQLSKEVHSALLNSRVALKDICSELQAYADDLESALALLERHNCAPFLSQRSKRVMKIAGATALLAAGGFWMMPSVLGFGAAGMKAGSVAAWFQSKFLAGVIAKGGWFAALQSVGALGGFSVSTCLASGGLLGIGSAVSIETLLTRSENVALVQAMDDVRSAAVELCQVRPQHKTDLYKALDRLRKDLVNLDSVLKRELALSEQNERRTEEVSTALLASLYVFVVSGVAAK
mmetsp:Transcript_69946/g.194561  ORF Transcript_69946/g.194561 Transcript_69946/m.194561 type:complete len:386 (+) Transcript_69946:78-1235(+)